MKTCVIRHLLGLNYKMLICGDFTLYERELNGESENSKLCNMTIYLLNLVFSC